LARSVTISEKAHHAGGAWGSPEGQSEHDVSYLPHHQDPLCGCSGCVGHPTIGVGEIVFCNEYTRIWVFGPGCHYEVDDPS
jgi:hypothetical protein